MPKLRLDLDSIAVETFATTPRNEQHGTVMAFSAYQTRCANTCNLGTGCYDSGGYDNLCTGNCTGIGVECYTADPQFYACTGGADCTGANACTHTTCTIDNVTCAYNCTEETA